jgi:hypothetical protein
MLTISDLHTFYGHVHALRGVSIEEHFGAGAPDLWFDRVPGQTDLEDAQ